MHKLSDKLLLIILSCWVLNSAHAQSFNGKTQWSNTYDISSFVSSSVTSIDVKKGEKISKGTQLLVMDDTNFKLDVNIAQAKLAVLAPLKEEADMDLNRAFERYDRTLISDVTLKTAEFRFAKAKAEYDAALAVLHKAQFMLESTVLKSPIDGRILNINTAIGYYSNSDTAKSLITIVDDTKMYAVAYLKVSQWDQSLVGKKATVVINKTQYKGVVESLSLLPEDKANGISVYPITVEFSVERVYPEGMPLTINIQ